MTGSTGEYTTATTQGLSEPLAATSTGGSISGLLGRGLEVGRYVVLEHVGAGGMGDVYAAYDPELDRKVALKLLRGGQRDGAGPSRLLREAQAMAKLAHPNVVAVFDVGTYEGRVFLAMEFVHGVTLTARLAGRPHAWPEVLEIFTAACRGLAAAHRAGLVHRDLKPDNLMIGDDGRVRVMDFGLARADLHELATTAADGVGPVSGSVLDAPLTRAGALLGTPLYMAPEQWEGRVVDARADQFSLCVALWEALFGERPFKGESASALMRAVTRGEIAPPARPGRAPVWLRRVVERGLATDSDARFPSIDALLAALVAGQARTRRRRLVGVGLAVVGLAGAGVGARHAGHLRTIAACDAAGAEIGALWDAPARTSLREALVATDVADAGATYERAVPWIDRWTQAWASARTQVCREVEVDTTLPIELGARAAACLDERRDQFAALLAALAGVDAGSVARVVPAVAGLVPPSQCLDQAALARQPAPPADAEARARVAELRRELGEVKALSAAGRLPAALARAETLLAAAEALGHEPLVAEVRAATGTLASKTRRIEQAEEALTRAYVDAGALGLDEIAAAAAVQLVYTVGAEAARFAEAVQWSRSAELLLRKLGSIERLDGADLWSHLGSVHRVRGNFDEAIALHTRAIEIRTRELGDEHPHVAAALHNLANLHEARGSLEEGLALHVRALARMERTLGPDHPNVAKSYNSQAVILEQLGRPDEALELHAKALAISERTLGPDHPNVAGSLFNIAIVHEARGDHDEARRLYERVLAIREAGLPPDHPDIAATLDSLAGLHRLRGELDVALALRTRALEMTERALGPDHPDVAGWLNNLGILHEDRGDRDEARRLYVRALAIHEKALGPDHPHVAETLANLADVRRDDGAFAEAEALYTRALAIWQQAAPDHPHTGLALVGLGELALARGRPAEAVAPLERVVALWSAGEVPPADLAQARFALARALVDDRTRALALAAQAAEVYQRTGDARLAEVEKWSRAGGGNARSSRASSATPR